MVVIAVKISLQKLFNLVILYQDIISIVSIYQPTVLSIQIHLLQSDMENTFEIYTLFLQHRLPYIFNLITHLKSCIHKDEISMCTLCVSVFLRYVSSSSLSVCWSVSLSVDLSDCLSVCFQNKHPYIKCKEHTMSHKHHQTITSKQNILPFSVKVEYIFTWE